MSLKSLKSGEKLVYEESLHTGSSNEQCVVVVVVG